jgi:hypothetical protein
MEWQRSPVSEACHRRHILKEGSIDQQRCWVYYVCQRKHIFVFDIGTLYRVSYPPTRINKAGIMARRYMHITKVSSSSRALLRKGSATLPEAGLLALDLPRLLGEHARRAAPGSHAISASAAFDVVALAGVGSLADLNKTKRRESAFIQKTLWLGGSRNGRKCRRMLLGSDARGGTTHLKYPTERSETMNQTEEEAVTAAALATFRMRSAGRFESLTTGFVGVVGYAGAPTCNAT